MADVVFEVIDGQEVSYYRKEKESDTIDGHVTKVPYVIDEDANASLASMSADIGTMRADIALMKADLAAILAILES